MLEVGVNTYVTIEESEKIAKMFYSIGNNFPYWQALEDEQKEGFLIQSAQEMELIPVNGRKVEIDQAMQFPRLSNFYFERTIPLEVKNCQVINAMDIFLLQIGIGDIVQGKVLTSSRAEKEIRRWTSGGFKMEGYNIW